MTAPKSEVRVYLPDEISSYSSSGLYKFVSKSSYDQEVQALKEDIEKLVKMYGDKKNWRLSASMLNDFKDQITDKDWERFPDDLQFVGGLLARQIAAKRGIKI